MSELHDKERCAISGLWKPKGGTCDHCATQKTRKGSPMGIKQHPEMMAYTQATRFGIGGPINKAEEARARIAFEKAMGWYEEPKDMETIQGVLRAREAKAAAQMVNRNTKERCKDCGNWKPKDGTCKHCAKLLNRKQAAEAQAEGRTQKYEAAKTSTTSRSDGQKMI